MTETSEKADSDLFENMAVAAAVFFAVFFAGYILLSRPPSDAFGELIGRDFVNMWMGGRAALSGSIRDLFAYRSYMQSLHALFPAASPHNWSYPPDVLLFIWPLGLLPYFPALLLWSAAGFALWFAAALPRRGGSATQFAFVMLSPAVAMNLFSGQNGCFTAALMVAGLVNLERKPLLAGLFFGLLTMKPQLGLLIPLALLLRREWLCIASAACTAALLFVITTLCFGFSTWTDYAHLVLPVQSAILWRVLMPMMMPSAFMNMRELGFSSSSAALVQMAFTGLSIFAVAWTYMARRDEALSRAVLITACLLATPYMFNYDMVALGWAIWNLRARFTNVWDERLAVTTWALPAIVMILGFFHLPGTAPVMAAFLLRLLRMLREDAREAAAAEAAAFG